MPLEAPASEHKPRIDVGAASPLSWGASCPEVSVAKTDGLANLSRNCAGHHCATAWSVVRVAGPGVPEIELRP